MRQRITNGVVQQMLPYLNNAQIEKLKDVLEQYHMKLEGIHT